MLVARRAGLVTGGRSQWRGSQRAFIAGARSGAHRVGCTSLSRELAREGPPRRRRLRAAALAVFRSMRQMQARASRGALAVWCPKLP
jgi:hypothetical protein